MPPGNDNDWRRLHPATLLTRVPKALRQFLNWLPLLVLLYAKGNIALVIFGGVAILILGWLGIVLSWLRFRYRLGSDAVEIESGLFERQHRVLPFDRIHDVAIAQGIIARLAGVARVQLETGSAGKAKEEGDLNSIALTEAEALRRQVRAWRADHAAAVPGATQTGDTGSDAADPSEREDLLFTMSPRRVLIHGLFNFSLILFAGLFGLLQLFEDFLPFDPLKPETWLRFIEPDSPIVQTLMAHRIAALLAGLLFVALIGVASGVVTSLMRNHGFRLSRTVSGLRRQRGLTTRTDVAIPVRRVQAATIGTGIVRSRFGWHNLKLQSLASDDAGEADHDVAPLARIEEVDQILTGIGFARSDDAAPGWRSVHPALWRRSAIVSLPLAGIAMAAGLLVTTFGGIPFAYMLAASGGFAAAMLLWSTAAKYWRWSHHFYRLDGERVEIRHGWLKPRQLVVPLRNIQSVDMVRGPLDRLFGIASLRLGIAGQSMFGVSSIAALPVALAREVRSHMVRPS